MNRHTAHRHLRRNRLYGGPLIDRWRRVQSVQKWHSTRTVRARHTCKDAARRRDPDRLKGRGLSANVLRLQLRNGSAKANAFLRCRRRHGRTPRRPCRLCGWALGSFHDGKIRRESSAINRNIRRVLDQHRSRVCVVNERIRHPASCTSDQIATQLCEQFRWVGCGPVVDAHEVGVLLRFQLDDAQGNETVSAQ